MRRWAWVWVLAGMLVAGMPAGAVPACPAPVEVTQPDGMPATVYLRGDEHRHWHEDRDGYLVTHDPNQHGWVYAEEVNGVAVPTRRLVDRENPAAAGLTRYHPRREAQAAARMTPPPAHITKTGTLKNLVVLVNFTDLAMTNTAADFDALFNQTNYTADGSTGSVRDYYRVVSNGKLTIASTVVGPVTVSRGYAYYGADGSYHDTNVRQMVQEALGLVDASGFDFRTMDGDGDGWVDALTIIHAGGGQEYGGNDSNYIWSHAWSISTVTYDGVNMASYHTEPARRGWDSAPYTWGITRVGVICHETAHVLGLPDLYDYGYDSRGAGGFCLMSYGTWGNDGATPVQMSAWCKAALGWVTPTPITAAGTFALPSDGVTVYKVQGNFPNTEYFLLENRQGGGFDASLPGTTRGLLIWHIDESMYGNDDQTHYEVDLEEASGTQHLQLNQGDGDDADYFRADTLSAFHDSTVPNSRSYGNLALGIGLAQIGASGPAMTFTATVGAAGNHPPVATNLSLRMVRGSTLYGTLPATDPDADPLTFRVMWMPSAGTVTILNRQTGYFSYRMRSSRAVSDIFTFLASDGKVDSNIATAAITVNNAPVATSSAFTVKRGTTYAGRLRATDADGDDLSFTITAMPRYGALNVIDFAGGFTYTPNTTRSSDSFSFRVYDGYQYSSTATVRITIAK